MKAIKPSQILVCFIILNLVIGIFIVQDFGRSTDEAIEYRTSLVALDLYTGNLDQNPTEKYEALNHDRFYGTASTAAISFIENYLFPNIDQATKLIAHYSYFLFFQAAIFGIFILARNFFDEWVSLFNAILFGTQPLLFGHAFINPKDIPILTTFLFTVILGFEMVDRWGKIDDSRRKEPASPTDQQTEKTKKRLIFIFSGLFLVLWTSPWITNSFIRLVEYSFNTKDVSLIGKIFARLTTYGSLEGYLTLARISVIDVIRVLSILTPIILVLVFKTAKKNNLANGKINVFLLLAGSMWGFAISTRVLAFAAGGMVGLYAIIKFKRSAVFPLLVYTMTAGMISFISWPLLWVFDISVIFESISLYKDFPWTGLVLFDGQRYLPTELPASYVPKLMMLQFTEPMVILAISGLVISLILLFKRKTNLVKHSLILAWFFLPLLYTIIWHPTIYSNFRHLLFITPPLFIFAGFAVEQLSNQLKKSKIILALCLLLIVPGIISIIQIHPYEYIYYNSFIGGIDGANNKYHLDYWGTAYKDAMDYANENFPSGSRIIVWKDNLSAEIYAEERFNFTAHYAVEEQDYEKYDYLFIPSKEIGSRPFYAEYSPIFSVDLEDVSLLTILEIHPKDDQP